MHLGCPFYGYSWPERAITLVHVGGNRCGLDFEQDGPCVMEVEDRPVNYFVGPLATHTRTIMSAFSSRIYFVRQGKATSLDEWEAKALRR